jgi:hypothetical protein
VKPGAVGYKDPEAAERSCLLLSSTQNTENKNHPAFASAIRKRTRIRRRPQTYEEFTAFLNAAARPQNAEPSYLLQDYRKSSMSTEHGVGLIPAARSFNDLDFTDDEIIAFWKSTPSFTELGKLLGVRRRLAWVILQKIGEAHPDEVMPGRPWSRLKTSEKIVKSIKRLRPMQPEQEAALLRVWDGSSSEKKADIKKKFKRLIAASDIVGLTNYLGEMKKLSDRIAMPPPPVPPPKEVLVTRGSVTVLMDPNASESDLSESETEEGGSSGAS